MASERREFQHRQVSETPSSPAVTPRNDRRNIPWADRPADEEMDHDAPLPTFDDEEEEGELPGVKAVQVSDNTGTFLWEAFTRSVTNATRKKWREKHGVPKSDPTRTPRLDKIVRDRVTPRTAKADKDLARIQTFVLDAVGPLSHLLELEERKELDPRAAVEAARMALRFLGNASVQISRSRRKAAIADMNRKLGDLAEDDGVFSEAAPNLFGNDFYKVAKEREEQLRCLDSAAGSSRRNFQGGHIPRKGGGHGYYPRGAGRKFGNKNQRFTPYQDDRYPGNYQNRYPGNYQNRFESGKGKGPLKKNQ